MSGYVGDLSEDQEQALAQFREKLKDVMQPDFDDYYLLKWLRARNFNVDKAEMMLRKNLQWRKQMDVDNILDNWTPPEVLTKYYPGGLFGHTKDGLPVWIEPAGSLDPKGLLYSCKKSDILKFKIQHCEMIQRALKRQSEKMGHRIENIIVICDFEHYGLKHLWRPAIDIFKEVLNIYEPHYPETLRRTYIINANRFFSILFNIGKPFLSDDTKDKVVLLGANWKQELLKIIDADQLPVKWGGTAVDEDGDICCRSKIGMGGQVPEHYRLPKHHLLDSDKLSKVTVARGSKVELEYKSTLPQSVLIYQFYTENHDIAFAIYRRTVEGKQNLEDMEQIRFTQRVNCHMIQEDGCVQLKEPGTYVLVFDNSFSWINSKKVVYNIQVLPPYNINDLKHSASFTSLDDSEVMLSTRL